MWGQHSRCAGLAARSAAALAFAALPGSARVVRWMEGGQPPFVAAADLTQDLQPLAGFHTVSRLNVQRLLRVHHLEHLTDTKLLYNQRPLPPRQNSLPKTVDRKKNNDTCLI